MQNFFLSGRHIRVSRPTEQRRPQVAPQGLSGVVAAPTAAMLASGQRAELRAVQVTGLPNDFGVSDIKDFMNSYGKIIRCEVLPPTAEAASFKPGFTGRACVEYDSELAAFEALRALQGFALKGGGVLQLHLGLGSADTGGTTTTLSGTSVSSALPSKQDPLPAPKQKQDPPAVITSKILLLENMVGPGEADEDLADEVREECESFGKVVDVMSARLAGRSTFM